MTEKAKIKINPINEVDDKAKKKQQHISFLLLLILPWPIIVKLHKYCDV